MKKWVNPYTVAFVVGAAFLTALPLMQRQFLSAPAPVGAWGEWQLSAVDDGTTKTSATFAGKVVLANFVPNDCDSACVDNRLEIGKVLGHTDDLGDKIAVVTFAWPSSRNLVRGKAHERWYVLSGDESQLWGLFERFRASWATFAHTDAGNSAPEFSTLPAYMLVDQLGAIRGFWKSDEVGRGNSINAARLLAKEGPNP
ncbi:MAG: hypothetical protein K1X64_16010 [Myxococcaceae bacterium]|nr:hypothetical protein [Myxococcaceae bacterium]